MSTMVERVEASLGAKVMYYMSEAMKTENYLKKKDLVDEAKKTLRTYELMMEAAFENCPEYFG